MRLRRVTHELIGAALSNWVRPMAGVPDRRGAGLLERVTFEPTT